VLADSPVSYWRLGEQSGTTAADSGAGGNPGTIVGGVTLGAPGALAGDPNTAMTFNGGYVNVPNKANLDPTGDLTVEAWAKPTTLGVTQTVVHKGDGTSESGWQYRLSMTSSNHWRGTVYVGGTAYTVTDPNTESAGQWYYLAMTRSGSTLTLYVNGAAVATTTVGGALNSTTGLLAIGRTGSASEPSWSTYPFAGTIDEVAVYNHALTATRVQAHYAAAH
jgi:hypothetical protein